MGKRRRPLRKRRQLVESSISSASEKIQEAKDSESDGKTDTTDDDPVARMQELTRLPLTIMEVRKLSEEIGKVCDELEDALTSDSPDQDGELNRLKGKLMGLTEKVSPVVLGLVAIPDSDCLKYDLKRRNKNRKETKQELQNQKVSKIWYLI